MDSLTQIVLGAAVGEITLGKKVGNRALLWGAVGGTIPDLDVLTGVFMTPLQELAAHRGFSHSIVFAFLGAWIFGWMIHYIYRSAYHSYIAFLGWFMIPAGVVYFISRIFEDVRFSYITGIGLGALLIVSAYMLYRRYFTKTIDLPDASLRDWQWLMFWSIFTHPLLDCFTTYGTQLFQPFSDYRVAFNTIAVADPLYTVPFLICIIILSYYSRSRDIRRKLAIGGICISSLYMLVCVFNKSRVNKAWTKSLDEAGIEYSRYMSSPSILNNILWSCLAETEDGYIHGVYSLFDKTAKVDFLFTPRNPDSLDVNLNDPTIERLRWFSNDYFSIMKTATGIQVNDMRFGTLNLGENDEAYYIFNFVVQPKSDGGYEMLGSNGGPPPEGRQEMLSDMWERIKGVE